MRGRRSVWLAALALVVAIAVPAIAQANEVTKWNQIATSTLVQFPGPGGGAPPALQINMGMAQGAVYAAINAIERRHRPIVLKKKFPKRASKKAAVATAAYRVLSSLVLDERAGIPSATKTALLQTLETERTNSLDAIAEGWRKKKGVAAGKAAADAMLADRANDGRFGPSPWVPNPDPGHWQPLLDPVTLLPILDPTPWVANVRPFLIKSPSQFRTDGPLDLSSQAWADEFKEVKRLGRATGSGRTDVQTQIALFWQSAGGPALLWNPVARQLADNPAYDLDIVESAFLFGMLNLTAADAAINCWNDKYYWDFWRPWNAIRLADTDGNPATTPDPTWAALLTAPYPDHPSGHLCADGAHLRVLQMFFGDTVHFGVTSSRFGGETRFFDHFSEPLAEITEARIWAGLHFRTADVQAKILGQNVARYMAEHYFQPVGNH
jgi:PAP2 superfamily